MNEKNNRNSQNTSTAKAYPWYDDRGEILEEASGADEEWPFSAGESWAYNTPKRYTTT